MQVSQSVILKKMSKLSKGKYIFSDHKQTNPNINNIQTPVKVETKIEELIQSVEFMGKQFDNFNNKVDSLLNEMKNLKIENEEMKNENNYLLNEVTIIKNKIKQTSL
jgi:FtsZ-binding cell division protein ZapB